MTLKTGMLVGIVGTEDLGVLIQIRSASNTCVIKLNNGTLKKNVPLEDVEEAKDMSDTKEKKPPIRLGVDSPGKSTKLASLSDARKSTEKLKTISLVVGDSVRARCNGGSRWFSGKIIRVNQDGTYDVEYSDGDIERKMAQADVEAESKLNKSSLGASKKLDSLNFAVDDKVKARFKKGTKLFSGKIARVRLDGTYDINYDDGDTEMRVAKEMIELNSDTSIRKHDSGDEAPSRRKKSSGFRVDQLIKARFKGGKKLFPGKIKRVHSDGTYDILYEDGDEEKRVKAENIEATGDPKADSDEDRKPANVSSRSKALTVGKKVKAHYKKGKRLFPGKISRVRSDGTYDIDYDDGEVETRMEASQIEVEDEDDMFADSDEDIKRTTTKMKAGWLVGDRVKAYYGKGKRLFLGKIVKIHLNGTYDIKYDDGDSEVRVEVSLIEAAESDLDDREKSGSKSSIKRPLRVGDAVKAKYKRGTRFFAGKITRERMDGTFDIKYEDGDVEERVEADLIQRVDDDNERDEDDKKPKKKSKKIFEVGDVVKAPFQRGTKLFRGKISRVRSDGMYDITFDDGDKDTHVPGDLVHAEVEEQDTHDNKPKKKALKVGDAVKARYKKGKKLFAGTVTRVRSDGTYDIKYDDGDVEIRVDIEMIEISEGKREDDDEYFGSSKSKKSFKVGDKVCARYHKGSKMFSGEITHVHHDGTYDIRYNDGDKEKHVEANDIELEDEHEPAAKGSSALKVGDSIEANYKNGVKMFPGKISRVHSDGSYDITFSDGDSERRVPRSRIKLKMDENTSAKKKTGFAVGDAVKAKYKKGTKYFLGKIARVRSNGTYDIEYDDGDSETRVEVTSIIAADPKIAQPSESSSKSSKTKRFEVGDVIKARYKKGTKLFPGKVTRVRSDGTYDIRYDDGDTEMYVETSYIEGEERLSSRDKADDKKPEGFAVGNKVNARYKGGLKSFPGKIIQARLDGTFDVEYDDGDMELRVKSSAIELVSGSKVKKSEAKSGSEKDDIFGDSDSDSKDKKGGKKSASLRVGDVIEANFKQKGKFHRGKIVRTRSDGTFDIEYDVGATETYVHIDNFKRVGGNQGKSDDSDGDTKSKKKTKKAADKQSSGSDREPTKPKSKKAKKSKKYSSSESSGSDREKQAPINKGARVTYRKAEDLKSRRIGTVRKVHSDGSCDVKYDDGNTSKRIARKLLVECSDSEDSEGDSGKGAMKRQRAEEGPTFRRHERVLSNWRRSSKLSKPRIADKWSKATVLEKNSDGTYTIRYNDGVVEEDVPVEALKPSKKKNDDSGSDEKSDASGRRRKKKLKRTNGISTESLFLLEQLAMTLFEEGILKKKPKLQLLRGDSSSSSSESSSSSTDSGSGPSKSSRKRNGVDKVLKRLFDSSSLQTYRRMFKENDVKKVGKISRSRVIDLVEELLVTSTSSKTSTRGSDDGTSVNHILTEWFATHDDLRTHRHFEFKTLMLAFAYAKSRLGKLRMERSVATVLEGRFASYHENKRQLELWQQKLGYRLFETLQRHFHDHTLPNMIPSRIRVPELSLIFEQVARQAMPNKPLDVYLQQHQLFPHHTLLLPEFLCCYYQLYGSEHSAALHSSGTVELRPIAFVASCLFSNGDNVCKRHGDLVRRLSVGRTRAQVDLILRFREAFESLLNTDTDGDNSQEEVLLETSQLSTFAAKVTPDPTLLEPAMTTLRKRSGAVSLVEIYASCGFIIDELSSAPTIRNAIEKMRMRVDLAEVRRIIGLVRNICVKILRFPNNADYWRIRANSAAFQQKIGRFDGATSLLEAVGFIEHQKTHYELRGARNTEGKRISALEKWTLDALRDKCVQLDGELSLFDGVESISSIFQRISEVCEREGNHFTLEDCQSALKNLSTYIENVLKNPKDSRCWRIREANSTFQRQIGYLPFAMELMESIGFELIQTSHENTYTLRGTGMTGGSAKKSDQEVASMSNFAFTSVSSQMEWFLWRRKQEIDSLLEDEMRYLHDIVGKFSHSQNNTKTHAEHGGSDHLKPNSTEARDTALIKMYPYGTNAMETFNKSSIQQHQLDTMRNTFNCMDVDQKGFLVEADFSRKYGSPSTLPVWSRFDAFDIGKDGKVDIQDFVAALGPLLDHPYELLTNKNGEPVASLSADDSNITLCEAASLTVGNLRLETTCAVAAATLEALLIHIYNIIQEPENTSLWTINDKSAMGIKFLHFSAGRELLSLVGFRESTDAANDKSAEVTTRNYELQPQRVRFKTSTTVSELPTSLDTATITRIQTIAAMLSGHYRGLNNPTISDVSAVSRAISAPERMSERWSRVVQLAVKCLKNIESDPENPRYRELYMTTNTFTKIVSCVQGGMELLVSLGFRETDFGTLVIPSDIPLDVITARKLELEVGLALLHLKMTTKPSTMPQKLDQSASPHTPGNSGDNKHKPALGTKAHLEMKKRKQHTTRNRQNTVNRDRPATTRELYMKNPISKQRPQTARTSTDPIEKEILSNFPHEEVNSHGAKLNRGRSTASSLSRQITMGHDRGMKNRKQVQRRAPTKPPSGVHGHAMVLAEDVDIGSDAIVVQKGQFVLRGAYVRIGSEIRDLGEERVVVEVTSNNERIPRLTRLRLGLPLQFFHPANELVANILLPTVELTRRLEISDAQVFARELICDLIVCIVEHSEVVCKPSQAKEQEESQCNKLATTVVTSFEIMVTLPLASSNVQIGPSMRYLAVWDEASSSSNFQSGVSIFNDRLSDQKLQAYWEGLVLQSGTSDKMVRLGDVKRIVPRNVHLSLLLSTSVNEAGIEEDTMSDDFLMTYEDFRAFFRIHPNNSSLVHHEAEDHVRLHLLAYLWKHFHILLQGKKLLVDGFKCVHVSELLNRMHKDIQDHPPVVSDDPQDNQAGLEIMQNLCYNLENVFTSAQRTGQISWPELVYFVRYNKHLMTPEIFPSTASQCILAGTPVDRKRGSREVADVVSGKHSSRLLVLFFDGSVEIWNLSSNSAVQESKAIVLFLTKKNTTQAKENHGDSTGNDFMQAWIDAHEMDTSCFGSQDTHAQRISSRIRQFKRSNGTRGSLVRFCAWDSALCVNSSVLKEPGSGTFRFFQLANSFVSPSCQLTVGHKSTNDLTKKDETAPSVGVVKDFEVMTDGSKIVFLTDSESILWIACAGTGEVLCHVNLKVAQVGKFRTLFQIVDKRLPDGENQTQLYVTTSAKSCRHAEMWLLPQGTNAMKEFEKRKLFSFGKTKAALVVDLVVSTSLLFVASRDGSIMVWSTTIEQVSPILPLVCLQIPLRNEELQSISCQSIRQEYTELKTCKIQVGDSVVEEIYQWELEVLQRFNPPPLRFAVYLFDDGEVICLALLKEFDIRLVKLDDPAFECDVFLTPVSGVEQNQARRVTLQKNRIIRVVLIALQHSRDGIFAQKATHEFFKDLEKYGILWKTRDEMMRFAHSYPENIVVQLEIFYRHGDSGDVELTQPQCLKQDDSSDRVQHATQVLIIGAILKSRAGDQTQFQPWKFAMNWLADDVDRGNCQLDHARRALTLQSSYRLEVERLKRIQNDAFRELKVVEMESRRAEMIQCIKKGVCEIIAYSGRSDEVIENLLRTVNIFMLASFDLQVIADPVESFFLKLFNWSSLGENTRAEVSSLVELLHAEEERNVCFGAWVKPVVKELLSAGNPEITRNDLNLIVRYIQVCTFTTTELGGLFVDIGLANAYNNSGGGKLDKESEFQSLSSLPSLFQQLHWFLSSTGTTNSKALTLESTMYELLPSQAVVEFIVECTNFSGFFQAKMAGLWTNALVGLEDDQNIPEVSYAMQLKIRRWQEKLYQLAQSQNSLNSEVYSDKIVDVLEPTAEDLQRLQRFLKTPLPCVSPKVSSITLENRCDTIQCHNRLVMNALGRVDGVGMEHIPLSVVYLFMENGEEAKLKLQQELTFLRKVHHLRPREYFLPASIDTANAPILPRANGSFISAGDTDEIRCIVAESLSGWISLTDCLKLMMCLPNFSMGYWKPLLWRWSIHLMMALLTMQNERFIMREGIDMDMLLVSPDGCDLRLCSLSGGSFPRFGDNDEGADLLSQEASKVFGCFIYELMHRVLSIDMDVSGFIPADIDDEMLRNMRKKLIWLLSSNSNNDDDQKECSPFLTDFSSVSEIVARGVCTRECKELEKLCELGLLGLQTTSTRPLLQSLWVYAGRPGMEILSEENEHVQTLSSELMTLVGCQRSLQKLQRILCLCFEECDDESCDENNLRQVVECWIELLKKLFQLKMSAFNQENSISTRIFTMTLGQTVDNWVPHQLCAITMRIFTQYWKHGEREQGRKALEILLQSFTNVFELVEANVNFDELQGNYVLMATVRQIFTCLTSVASGQMPVHNCNVKNASTTACYHRDAVANAVLWRLCEPLFRNLLTIETTSSKFAVLLQWLDSRRPPFGYTPLIPVGYENSGGQPDSKQVISLWWNDHAPLIPRYTCSSATENELIQNGYSTEWTMTANYMRCVYETKEIEFKLTSGVSLPKFRLAALQQFFGPTFFDHKHCFPMVFVRSLVATVWRDLAFERLLCTLLRDNDEKIVLGGLSLLECSTRVFRFDASRSSQIKISEGTSSRSTSMADHTFGCPERVFALHLCSQLVVFEVKRVLDITIRTLKVLGESGTASASRSQHPLIAILSVGLAWLVNCLHGGDSATQFWSVAGVDQLIIAHSKANSLPFVKVKDSNMINELFRKGQRLTDQDTATSCKWRVFTSGSAESIMHRSGNRNCSPFYLMVEEIIFVGSNRAVGLMRTLLMSKTFREEARSANVVRDSVFQRELISSNNYGNVSHAIDLARDITQLNGTINEQVQAILYSKAIFLNHTATSVGVRVNVFAPVCGNIWCWVEAAWRNVTFHSSSSATGTDEKGVRLSRAQGDVVITGLSLLHSIITRPTLSINEIVELTTFTSENKHKVVNVLYEIVGWIANLPCGLTRLRASTIDVLIEIGVTLLINFVQSTAYGEVAFATMNTCVDIRCVLKLIFEPSERNTIVSVDEKLKLWSMLLYFDNCLIASRILETGFLDSAVILRLLSLDVNTHSSDAQVDSLNGRLEAAMLLEVLICSASRSEKSVATRMLFAEACKLLVHHDIIMKETAYLRKARDISSIVRKQVAVCKRVMQLICCLCIDFSSDSPNSVFLNQFKSVGVPAWVVNFHQTHFDKSANSDELLTRVEQFWKDWQGQTLRFANSAMMREPTSKNKSEKYIIQTSHQRIRRHDLTRKNQSIKLETIDSDDNSEMKLERPLVSVSPVKIAAIAPKPRQPNRTASSNNVTNKNSSVIQTFLSIDADSALRLIKKPNLPTKAGSKQPKELAGEEELDSDAYSPYSGISSFDEDLRRANLKASAKLKPPNDKKSTDAKVGDKKQEQDNATSETRNNDDSASDSNSHFSQDRPRRTLQKPKYGRTRVRNHRNEAISPRNEALRGIFRKYDVDGDGAISFIDLRRAMDKQMTGHRISDLEIQRWITEKDRSGQGVVSFEDFVVAFETQLKQ